MQVGPRSPLSTQFVFFLSLFSLTLSAFFSQGAKTKKPSAPGVFRRAKPVPLLAEPCRRQTGRDTESHVCVLPGPQCSGRGASSAAAPPRLPQLSEPSCLTRGPPEVCDPKQPHGLWLGSRGFRCLVCLLQPGTGLSTDPSACEGN